MESARLELEQGVALERWHWTCVGFCARGGGTVLSDVFDQPVHLVDLPTLRFADLDGQLAHSVVVDVEPLGSRDGERVVRDHRLHEGHITDGALAAVEERSEEHTPKLKSIM